MKSKKFIAIGLIILTAILSAPAEVYAAKKPITSAETICGYVNTDFWQKHGDVYLNELIIKALNNNHSLKTATLKVEETTEKKNIQRSLEMPMVGIGAVPALYKLPGSTVSNDIISLPAYASYEADIFGKNRDKTKSLDKMIEVSRQNERAAYISITGAVVSAYYNVVKIDRLIELQTEIINDRKKIYDIMKLSNDEGLVSVADTVNANKAYLKAESDMVEYKKAREHLLNLLCVLTGESPENKDEIKRIAFSDLNSDINIPESIESDVIFARPDFLKAEKMLEKSGIDVRAARKEFLPTINLFGLLSFNSGTYFSKLNWTNSAAVLGAGVLLPLFTGGRKIANLHLKKNQYEQALENYKQTSLTAVQEVNDALYDLKADGDKFENTQKRFDEEKRDFRFTQMKFDEGVISALEMLQKRENLLSVEKLYVSDKISEYTSMTELYKAAGADL